jgi:hypothetical protein
MLVRAYTLVLSCVLTRTPVCAGAQSLWSGNGHYYQLVDSKVGFSSALSSAASMTYLGRQGYLATITSAAENAFAASLCPSCWIGGSDSAEEGVWRWVAGPESGQAINTSFWGPGEPNNAGNEDFLQLISTGLWNDATGAYAIPYLVEFECATTSSPDGYCTRKIFLTTCLISFAQKCFVQPFYSTTTSTNLLGWI